MYINVIIAKIAAKSPQKIAVFAQKIVKNAFLYNICGDFFSKCGKFTPCGDKFLKPHKSSSSSISGV